MNFTIHFLGMCHVYLGSMCLMHAVKLSLEGMAG